MKPKVALIVGHYGPGTGCSFPHENHPDSNDIAHRDEFLYAISDVQAVHVKLEADDMVTPKFVVIDRRQEPWKWFNWTNKLQLGVKLNWLADMQPDAAISFHYNSANTHNVSGNEIVTSEHSALSNVMDKAFDRWLPNRHRSIKIRELGIFKAECPIVIIEPAFIFESGILRGDWQGYVVKAVSEGIYEFFGMEGWR